MIFKLENSVAPDPALVAVVHPRRCVALGPVGDALPWPLKFGGEIEPWKIMDGNCPLFQV